MRSHPDIVTIIGGGASGAGGIRSARTKLWLRTDAAVGA
jgi:glycerol-3-phosphate dehydrogenase